MRAAIPLAIATLALSLAPGPVLSQARPAAPASAPRVPSVTVVSVQQTALRERLVVTGTFVAREEVLVAAEIDGLAITEILVEEGDTVRQGQVLARLNREALDVQLAQSTAQLARSASAIAQTRASIAEAEAAKVQAGQALGRARQLATTGATSADILDQRVAASRSAEARWQAATQGLEVAEADRRVIEAQRRDIELRLARTEIRSRVAGVVSRRSARLGALAMGAGDPLFRIIADGAVELEAQVPETWLSRLRPDQAAAVRASGGTQALAGHVRLVAPEVDRQTRLGRVRIAVDAGTRPAIGSFGRGEVEIARSEGLVVPLSAVLFAPEGPMVQRVRDGAVESRPVTVGLRDGGRVEIRDGLALGDEVVSVSGTFLRAGDRVNPMRADGAAAGAPNAAPGPQAQR